MIALTNLTFRYSYRETRAVEEASCSFGAEGITAVVGGSGVGKSTIIALLAGIYVAGDPAVGELNGDIQLYGRTPSQLRGASQASWVPQTTALLDHLTVRENILLALGLKEKTAPSHRCDELIAWLGLSKESGLRPRELSGGMQTRVCLARALITRPQYLFLDEPFASLDLASRWRLYRLLQAERHGPSLRTVMTTHDIPEAMLISNRLVIVSRRGGRTHMEVVENTPEALPETGFSEVLAAARLRAATVEAQAFADH